MVWVIFSLFFAVASGLVGRVVLGDILTGVNAETVFMVMNEQFFNSFMAAIIISAILGAIMSTSSGQLLVTASAISTDFYQALLRKAAQKRQPERTGFRQQNRRYFSICLLAGAGLQPQ